MNAPELPAPTAASAAVQVPPAFTPTTRVAVAFDPSICETGYAVIAVDDNPALVRANAVPRIIDAGIITSRRKPCKDTGEDPRLAEIIGECLNIVQTAAATTPLWAVGVEAPARHQKSHAVRSATHLPTYGRVMGGIEAAIRFSGCLGHTEQGGWSNNQPGCVPIFSDPVDVWTRHYRGRKWMDRSIISTKNDPHKVLRVEYTARLFGFENGDAFGCKSNAGNIADALLYALFILDKTKPTGDDAADATPTDSEHYLTDAELNPTPTTTPPPHSPTAKNPTGATADVSTPTTPTTTPKSASQRQSSTTARRSGKTRPRGAKPAR